MSVEKTISGATRCGNRCERTMRTVAGAGHQGRLDELLLAQRQRLSPEDTRRIEPAETPEHQDEGGKSLADEAPKVILFSRVPTVDASATTNRR